MTFPAGNIGSFSQQCYDLEITPVDFWLNHNPSGVIDYLLERIKFGAKILADTAEIKRSAALNNIAVAVGFPDWHRLNAFLTKISASPSGTVSSESMLRLSKSLFFFIRTSSEVALSRHQDAAFKVFGKSLSESTGLPVDEIMDSLCAGYCGGATWSEVERRSPLRAKAPLYSFDVFDPKVGRFVLSEACRQLVLCLDDAYLELKTPALVFKARRWIEDALAQQPGFFEAGLCLAQIYYDEGNLNKAVEILNVHIKQAGNLIPKGFRGKIEWSNGNNRFYHRLLWLRMTIYHDAGWMRDCLKDARRQLRFNPSDNLGVRYIYPLMLLQVGEYEMANKAAKLSKEDGYHVSFVRSFCRFAIGDYQGFIQNLTKALFDLPVLRLILMDSTDDLPGGDDGFRSVEPDLETLVRYAWPAYQTVPGLIEACTQFLSNPSVQAAEAELRRYWMGFWRKGPDAVGDIHGWRELSFNLKSTIPLLLAAGGSNSTQ